MIELVKLIRSSIIQIVQLKYNIYYTMKNISTMLLIKSPLDL